MRYFKSLFIIALAVVTVAACSNKSETDQMEEQDTMQAGSQTIVSVASNNQNLSTLVQAVKAAERAEMLSDTSATYTVFAPTNEAFDALPEGALDDLMKPENKQKLGNILAYHVVEGTVMASDLADGQTVTTVQGKKLTITKNNGTVMVNGAQVVQADVDASNGVVHVIDKVLMPSNN